MNFTELALALKEDGAFHVLHKNYCVGIAVYTEGLQVKCGDKDIDAYLLNNRAMASYSLQHYNSSLRDCEMALRLKPDYKNALVRAASCSFEVMRYGDAIKYCNTVLEKDKDNVHVSILLKKSKIRLKSLKMHVAMHLMRAVYETQLLKLVKERGVKVFCFPNNDYEIRDLQPIENDLLGYRVRIDEERKMVWPLIFLHPDIRLIDAVERYCEDDK